MIALVDPPAASKTRSAFSTDFRFTMRSGVSWEPISLTAACPLPRQRAIDRRARQDLQPCRKDHAERLYTQAMVEVVPITAHVPAVVASLPSTSEIS